MATSLSYEDNVVYVAGQSLVLFNKTDRRQRFVQAPEISEVITAFASGPGKRLCAIAEHGEKPIAHIFDLRTFRRKKTLTADDSSAKDFVSMQFSGDDQMLLTLTGAPEYSLMCWNWAKAKLIAKTQVSLSLPVCRCSFSPLDASAASVIGKDYVRFFRIAEKDIRPLQETFVYDSNFTTQCWMRQPDDHLLVSTDQGAIHMFRSGEHVCRIMCSPGPEYPIYSMISIPGGFLAGSRAGVLLYFQYDEVVDQALFDHQFSLVNKVEPELCTGFIVSMFLDALDETLVMITTDGQMVHCPVVSPAKIKHDDVQFTICPFHGPKPITGMDVCVKKPLVLTCCKDNTLKLWNFQTHEIELQKAFSEEMFSVALHPTGLHCAVGFVDKMRIYHILVDDLRVCMEVSIKGCRDCRFSKGGHVLAAANGNSISVYDVYTGDKLAELRGHNSKVRSLHWMENGIQLLSCGHDGAVYVWDVDGAKRTGEFVHKGTMYTSAVCGGDSVFVVGSDRALRQLSLPDLVPFKVQDAGLVLTNVAISVSKNILFAGTGEYGRPGYVRSYAYPLTGDFEELGCTSSQVSRMRLTPDENFLVVAGELGNLVIYELKDRQDRFQRNNPTSTNELFTLDSWSDDIIVTRAELEDRASIIIELKTKVDELKLHNEYQLKLKEMNYAEKIKEVTDRFVQELEQAKTKLDLLKEERADSELEYNDRIRQMEEKHQHDVQETETTFQAQIMELVESYQQLTRDRDAQIERLEDQRRHLVASHEKFVDELTKDFEHKLDEDRQTRLQLEDEKCEVNRDLEENENQLEDDIDTEIENLRRTVEEKLTASRETTLKYKGENGIMKKKFIVMQRDIEDQKEEMKVLQEKEKDLHDQIKMLEKEVYSHKKEIKTRDVSIGEKEKRIYELKKKNQELDKFKFVLDFKIRELKMQIEPRQMEIMGMRDQIKQMDEELEKYHKTNASLDVMIGVLRDRIDSLQRDTRTKRMHAKQLENNIANFRSDVQHTIQHILTPDALRTAVDKLVAMHGSAGTIKPRIDPDVENEFTRHRDFLQRSVQELKRSLEDSTMEHMEANNRLMQQNMSLIEEINAQRESNKMLKMRVQADVGRVRHLAQALAYKKTAKNSSLLPDLKTFTMQDVKSLEGTGEGATPLDSRGGTADTNMMDPVDLLNANKRRIIALRAAIDDMERRTMMSKAYSREVLPPMDGVVVVVPTVGEDALD